MDIHKETGQLLLAVGKIAQTAPVPGSCFRNLSLIVQALVKHIKLPEIGIHTYLSQQLDIPLKEVTALLQGQYKPRADKLHQVVSHLQEFVKRAIPAPQTT